ncbi:thioredoxin [Candidatus Bandiella euplotis]|uniref:Thioredoxin n=1 Tax=Candidatus Bandiella euplotis TaxID=1664265 RepID=A0ABZ0UMC1_9RICK|nr:thioredoxin [Candidatus Bandiella woodruffii]WPX97281.1 Thioredoxin [Candidatus Bandiella woodruffii]
MTLSVSDKTFAAEVERYAGTVLVDFWAEWCGPCKQLSPIIDAVAQELDDKVKVMKMDIDENPETPSKFGIRSIPTLMLFKNGKHIDTKVGSSPKAAILDWIESHNS